jgi:hypothetical protein
MSERPRHYYRDGRPIVSSDPAIPDFLIWAMEFETADRHVAVTITPYKERLSTVFLGLDHSFSETGPPILFESMLFAPESKELRDAKRERVHTIAENFRQMGEALEEMEIFPEEEYIKTHYPHDQLQVRYSTEAQAKAGHRKLKLQCLIPPRWRRFLLYTIGRDALWS